VKKDMPKPNDTQPPVGDAVGEDSKDSEFKIKNISPISEEEIKTEISRGNEANTGDGSGEDNKVISFKTRLMSKLRPDTRKKRVIYGVLGVLFLLFAVNFLLVVKILLDAKSLKSSSYDLVEALRERDLLGVQESIERVDSDMRKLKNSYRKISWIKITPFFGNYVKDAGGAINAGVYGIEAIGIVFKMVEPHAEIAGFDVSEPKTDGGVGTQDKINFLVKSVPSILPGYEEVLEKVVLIENELSGVDPNRYPQKLRGYSVRANIRRALEDLEIAVGLLKSGKPLLEQLPYLAGVDSERTYMVIFQNDKELRPTGGFITAYSIMNVRNGLFEPVASEDIYDLDDNYTPSIEAPEELRKYLKGPYLDSPNYRLRDMNWEPDFSQAMEMFVKEVEKAGIGPIDGIIAVDTQMLVNIVDVLGVIDVPGFGGYSSDIVELCECPQIVYELEQFADNEGPVVWSENEPGVIVFAPENYGERKKIIGPMMETLLLEILSLPGEKIPELFEAVIKSVSEKHLLLYMTNEDTQLAVEKFGLGGVLESYAGDYLMVVDANLGGRKSNLYVTQTVNQKISVNKDGVVEKTLIVTYKNPKEHDGWLNSILPNWVRVYVPEGSELIEMSGFVETATPYDEHNKTVYSGYLEVRPMGVTEIQLKYNLPFTIDDVYNLYIQKQPGKDNPAYTVSSGNYTDEFLLLRDKIISIEVK
jgi:hypothetical protein